MKRTFCDCCGNEVSNKTPFALGKEVESNLNAHNSSPHKQYRSYIPFRLNLVITTDRQPHFSNHENVDLCENCTWILIDRQDKRPKHAEDPYPWQPKVKEHLTKFLNDKPAIHAVIDATCLEHNGAYQAPARTAILKTLDALLKYE